MKKNNIKVQCGNTVQCWAVLKKIIIKVKFKYGNNVQCWAVMKRTILRFSVATMCSAGLF
jgi:hypothetical protein